VRALLNGRSDVDGVRQELTFDTQAEVREAMAGTGAGERRQYQKPGTKDEGKRRQQRFVDRKDKVDGTFLDSTDRRIPNANKLSTASPTIRNSDKYV
jgi:hypothetical protein